MPELKSTQGNPPFTGSRALAGAGECSAAQCIKCHVLVRGWGLLCTKQPPGQGFFLATGGEMKLDPPTHFPDPTHHPSAYLWHDAWLHCGLQLAAPSGLSSVTLALSLNPFPP